MSLWQDRVLAEKEELDARIDKLVKAYDTDMFAALHPDERDRLVEQKKYMDGYSFILGERIAVFLQ